MTPQHSILGVHAELYRRLREIARRVATIELVFRQKAASRTFSGSVSTVVDCRTSDGDSS
jgi:hypothetical protein